MDPDSLASLLVILLMVCSGAYFSATETAFSALNRIRVKSMAEEDSPKRARRAELVLRLHDNFDNLLSTLLVLNNVVTLIAAAVSTLFFVRHFGDLGAPMSTVILTVIIVFLGDITPKSLAKESPETVAMAAAPLLSVLIVIVSPVNILFAKWKNVLGRIGLSKGKEEGMTEEELYSYVEVAHNDGIIDEDGKELIDSAILFNELKVIDILTPRIDVFGISEDSTEEEIAKMFTETDYSRLPVYRDSMDHIIGVVHMRDFFRYSTQSDKKSPLSSIYTEPHFLAPSAKISEVFKELRDQKHHFAVVSDEYGGTAGIVTMEDILEELVGDIWDESDEVIVEFSPMGENKHKIICSAFVKDLFAYLELPDDPEAESTTVSGWIMDKLGKLPEEGDSFDFNNITLTVHKTKHRRVLECIITVRPEEDDIDAQ